MIIQGEIIYVLSILGGDTMKKYGKLCTIVFFLSSIVFGSDRSFYGKKSEKNPVEQSFDRIRRQREILLWNARDQSGKERALLAKTKAKAEQSTLQGVAEENEEQSYAWDDTDHEVSVLVTQDGEDDSTQTWINGQSRSGAKNSSLTAWILQDFEVQDEEAKDTKK